MSFNLVFHHFLLRETARHFITFWIEPWIKNSSTIFNLHNDVSIYVVVVGGMEVGGWRLGVLGNQVRR